MAALGRSEIETHFDEVFAGGSGDRTSLRGAKYLLRLSGSELILPSGKRYGPEDERRRGFVLEPGESAYVSTRERIRMREDWIGLLGSRFRSAEDGILFFGGPLVDPGYGRRNLEGEPLSFTLANVGGDPLEFRPGDPIASIVFLHVSGNTGLAEPALSQATHELHEPVRISEELFAPGKQGPPRPLALVRELTEIRTEMDKLRSSVSQVVLLVVIVLGATLVSAMVAAILSLSDGSSSGTSSVHETAGELREALVCTLGPALLLVILIVVAFHVARAPWARSQARRRRAARGE